MQASMGFAEDMIKGLGRAVSERFDAKPSRLAKAAGTHATTLGRILDGERSKWLNALGKIVDAAGLKVVDAGEIQNPAYAFIKKANSKASAGGGSLETSGEIEGGLVFKLDWIKSRTTSSPDRLRIMPVKGSSMSPTFDDGDVVLVDEGNKSLISDKVYVIRKGDEIYVKRFRKTPDALLFMGDNRARDFEDVRVQQGDEDGFSVIGRVLWAGKEL